MRNLILIVVFGLSTTGFAGKKIDFCKKLVADQATKAAEKYAAEYRANLRRVIIEHWGEFTRTTSNPKHVLWLEDDILTPAKNGTLFEGPLSPALFDKVKLIAGLAAYKLKGEAGLIEDARWQLYVYEIFSNKYDPKKYENDPRLNPEA